MTIFATNIDMIRKNLFTILIALLLLFLSLTNGQKFQNTSISKIPYIDKIVHFGMYFLLMMVIIIEHRKQIRNIKKLFLFSLFPLMYGILIEILQSTITTTRSGEFMDAVFDTLGIVAAVFIWKFVRPSEKEPVK
jgi:VanZ family protein